VSTGTRLAIGGAPRARPPGKAPNAMRRIEHEEKLNSFVIFVCFESFVLRAVIA
jgi:hypothetical protein